MNLSNGSHRMSTKHKASAQASKSKDSARANEKQKTRVAQQENDLASRSKKLFETPAGIQFLESAPSIEDLERHFHKAEEKISFFRRGIESSFPEGLEKLDNFVNELAVERLPKEVRESYVEIETAFIRACLTLEFASKREGYNATHPTILLLQAYLQWLMGEKLLLIASLFDERHVVMNMGAIVGALIDFLRTPSGEREDFMNQAMENLLTNLLPAPRVFKRKKTDHRKKEIYIEAEKRYRQLFRKRYGGFPELSVKIDSKTLDEVIGSFSGQQLTESRSDIRRGIKRTQIKRLAEKGRKSQKRKS